MIVGCPNCHLRYDMSLRDSSERVKCRCGASFMVPELAKIAKAWNCPNCGGATNPTKAQCEFCGVYLAFARCPECFSQVTDGTQFCSECGANIQGPAREDAVTKTELECPGCQKKLQNREVGGYHIDLCTACGGSWLDHEVLEKILNDKGKQKNARAIKGKQVNKVRAPDPDFVYRKCPYCQTIMHRRNFARKSGVIVDECVAHGIWFDKNELARIIDYAQSVIDVPKSTEHYVAPEPEIKKPKSEETHILNKRISYGGREDLVSVLADLLSSAWSKFR